MFAARSLGLQVTAEARARLVEAFGRLLAWDDVAPALAELRRRGLRLAFLSNFTPAMLAGSIAASGFEGVFERAISIDAARTYKPDPRAYQLGLEATGVTRAECVFVALAGWDVAGARWFGYRTFWCNRAGQPAEELGVAADGTGRTLADLVAFLDA